MAPPNTVSAGAPPPLKKHSRSSIPNSEHTIPMDPCSRHGNYACIAGASEPPRGRQGNNRRNGTGYGRSHYYSHTRGHIPIYQGNHTRIARAHAPDGAGTFPGGQHLALHNMPPSVRPHYETWANPDRYTKRKQPPACSTSQAAFSYSMVVRR